MKYYVTSTTTNTKTGNIPTVWIGGNQEETLQSCMSAKCPLVPEKMSGKPIPEGMRPCYAWQGRVRHGLKSIGKAVMRMGEDPSSPDYEVPRRWNIRAALWKSARSARYLRLSAIGDPSALAIEDVEDIETACEEFDLGIIGYTAGWRDAPHLRGKVMASTYSLEQADEAIEAGWRPAVVVSEDQGIEKFYTTPGGKKIPCCPVIWNKEKGSLRGTNCNQCGWCDATRAKPHGVAFPSHI